MRLAFYIALSRAVFAVALAILLYFVALSETNPADQRDIGPVPVQPVNVPSGLVITTPPPPVQLRVTAPQNVFSRLRADSFTAQVDLSGARAGDNPGFPITVNSTDPEVRAVQAVPPTVNLHLEEVREQVLPVRVNSTGQVPPGYQVGTPSVDP